MNKGNTNKHDFLTGGDIQIVLVSMVGAKHVLPFIISEVNNESM